MPGVYIIRCVDRRVKDTYLGSTRCTLAQRMTTHRYEKKKWPNSKLQAGVRRNGGWSNFYAEWLEFVVDPSRLKFCEGEWQEKLQPTLNSNRCYTGVEPGVDGIEYMRQWRALGMDASRPPA